MNIPTSWKDITVSQYLESSNLKVEDFDYIEDYYIQLFSILTDEDPTVFEDMTVEQFIQLKSKIGFLLNLPNNRPLKTITTNNITLHLVPYHSISGGEFIDLESYIRGDILDNLTKLLAVCYRRVVDAGDLFNPPRIEKYTGNNAYKQKLFDTVCIADVYGVVKEYIQFRKEVFENYSNLVNFQEEEEMDEETKALNEKILAEEAAEEENLSISEKNQLQKAKELEENRQKWGFAAMILRLAGGDITKYNEILELPLLMIMNILAMKKELKMF